MLVTQGGSARKTRGSKRLRSKMEEKKQKAIVGDINYNTLVGDSVCGSGLLIGGGMGLEAREVGDSSRNCCSAPQEEEESVILGPTKKKV